MPCRARRNFFLVLIAAASCAPPLQSGGVEVQDGAAARLEALCRFRRGAPGEDGPCAAHDEATLGGLEVELIGPEGAHVDPSAGGRILLEPSQARAETLSLEIGPNIAQSGANVAVELPAGRYRLGFEGAGRRSVGEVLVTVEPGKIAKARLLLSAATTAPSPVE